MQRIAINSRHGGFGLSLEGAEHYAKLAGLEYGEMCDGYGAYWTFRAPDGTELSPRDIPRDCPHLIATIEALGSAADGPYAALAIIEIPDDVCWQIDEYDGLEWVAERHRIWSR